MFSILFNNYKIIKLFFIYFINLTRIWIHNWIVYNTFGISCILYSFSNGSPQNKSLKYIKALWDCWNSLIVPTTLPKFFVWFQSISSSLRFEYWSALSNLSISFALFTLILRDSRGRFKCLMEISFG